jgi:hypothetical protein
MIGADQSTHYFADKQNLFSSQKLKEEWGARRFLSQPLGSSIPWLVEDEF